MTVTATNASTGPYTANGSTATFPFTFAAASAAEVGVTVNGAAISSSLYSVVVTDGGGGSVTFLTAPAAASAIVVFSNPDFTQQTKFETQGSFLPTTFNTINDRAAIRDIYLKGRLDSIPTGVPGVNGATSDLAAFIGLFTGASGQNLTAGGTKPPPDVVLTTGYRVIGQGGGRYLRWQAPLAALPAVAGGENAWWFADSQGNKYYPDPSWLHFDQFGAYGDCVRTGYNTQTVNHDDLPAWNAFHNSYCLWAGVNTNGVTPTSWYAVGTLRFGWRNYYFSDSLEVYNCVATFEGAAPLGPTDGGNGTTFMFAAGKSGVRVEYYNTIGETTRTPARGATGSTFRNILCHSMGPEGGFSMTANNGTGNGACDGWHLRTLCQLIDCGGENFSRDGWHCEITAGSGGALEGNANLFSVRRGMYRWNGRAGGYVGGSDTNVAKIEGSPLNYYSNGRWGLVSTGGFGIKADTVHTASNGLLGGVAGPLYAPQTVPGRCVYGGADATHRNVYVVHWGKELQAQTTIPGTDSTVWFEHPDAARHGTSTATVDQPLWVTGMTWTSSGPFRSNGGTDVFDACYSEIDQNPSQFGDGYCKIYGGAHSALRIGGDFDGAEIGSGGGSTRVLDGLTTRIKDANGNNVRVSFGNGCGALGNFIEYAHDSFGVGAASFYQQGLDPSGVLKEYDSSGNIPSFVTTTLSTAYTAGRAAAPVGLKHFPLGAAFGNGGGTSGGYRTIRYNTAAPTVGGAGDVHFNDRSVNAKVILWSFTSQSTSEPFYRRIYGSAAYDPPSIAAGSSATTTVTVTGAASGDIVSAVDFGATIHPLTKNAWVSGADTVSVQLSNLTAGAIDLGSMTLKVEVTKQ